MAGKTRRSKAKKYSSSKKGRAIQRAAVTGGTAPAPVAGVPLAGPGVSPVPPTPLPVKNTAAKSAPAHYLYVAAELKRIGILMAIILVILVALALVLK